MQFSVWIHFIIQPTLWALSSHIDQYILTEYSLLMNQVSFYLYFRVFQKFNVKNAVFVF